MESSNCVGLMAVVAVSSSVAILVVQAHKRLVSNFMEKVHVELGGKRTKSKKKVTFAADVVEPSSNNEEYRRRRLIGLGKQKNAMIEDFPVSINCALKW